MNTIFDTIVAPITGAYQTAVAIVRVSGPEAHRVAAAVFPSLPQPPALLKLYFGPFSHGDEGYVALFDAAHGYTGEPAAEFYVHGSPFSVQQLVEACIGAGARSALPGEFSERAFLHGRIDLTQAEGVRDTVEAVTERQFRLAGQLRSGALHRSIHELRLQLTALIVNLDAHTDFSEELGELDREATCSELQAAIARLEVLLTGAKSAQLTRTGIRVALIGLPNAGKSSLMNAMLATERSIVTPIAGTTRDTIEATADLEGHLCHLVDTAGIADSSDPVECIGVDRAKAAAASADVLLHLYDSASGWSAEDEALRRDWPGALVVAAKADLVSGSPGRGLRVSSVTREGLPQLVEAIIHAAGVCASEPGLVVNPRHAQHLTEALKSLRKAEGALASDLPHDLAVTCLRAATDELGVITGETADSEMLNEIFRSFCIGK